LGTMLNLARSVRAFAKEWTRERDSAPLATARSPRIGLALSGGFARGFAHIGVLKVLEENRFPIHFIAGTSVGSIIGAAYCSGMSLKELEEIAALVKFRDFARLTFSRLGLCSNDRMAAFLDRLFKARTFEELNIPLAVTATDFITGEGAVWTSGPLVDPVRASCAYPGMFLPVRVNGRLYVDGLLAHAVPTRPLRGMGAERVVAVHLSAQWASYGPRHVFDVIGQCFSIAQAKMSGYWQSAADVVITPDVRGFSYDAFDNAKALVQSGERAAREMLPQLLECVRESSTAQPVASTLAIAADSATLPATKPSAA